MANKIIHARSSAVLENGNPKLPAADRIEYGELAINFADGVETISIKNKSNEIVEFKSKEYFEQIILDNEEVTAAALTDLDERVLAMENGSLGYATMEDIYAEGFLSFIPSEYVTESELANKRFLTSVPAEYVTETELDNRGYLTSVPDEYITETDLDNMGYLTSIPAEYVTETELSNKGYLTSIPDEYVTETELSNKGYLTSIPDEYVTETELSNYVTTTEFTTLSNDVDILKGEQMKPQTITGSSPTISTLEENTYYICTSALSSLTLSAFQNNTDKPVAHYKVFFRIANNTSPITFPSGITWAHGELPVINDATFSYELDIEKIIYNGTASYRGILVKFK